MYNTDYNYDDIVLWDDDTWKSKYSPACALFQWIEGKNNELFRTKAGVGPYTGRTDGMYNAKTFSNFYQEYIDRWAAKGLVFHSTEQGSVSWIAMLPKDVYDKKVHDPKVLVVLHDVDYSDPNWSIHTLIQYEHYNELAAKDKFIVLYICPNGVNKANVPQNIMQEMSVIYNLTMDPVYLDVSTVIKTGSKLKDIKGFYHTGDDGTKVKDPDACIEKFYDIPVLNITGRWQNTISVLMDIRSPWLEHPTFDAEKFVHSQQGRAMASSLRMEYDYPYGDDPAFKKHWEGMGLDFATHDHNGYQWVSFVPKSYIGQDKEKLPVVLLFQEVTYQDRHQIVSAIAAYKNYAELAATGELILLVFALESVEENDMFYDIALDAAKIYPVDLSRVYVTGQSHNGYFTDIFVHRHHDKIAACAPLSNHLGIPEPEYTTSPVKISDEVIEASSKYDMPTIVVTSIAENRNPKLHCRLDNEQYTSAARAFQRRLKACRCPMKTVEEINDTPNSSNYIASKIGYPVDRSEIQVREGAECYIGDITDIYGKDHLRFVVIENQTHFIAPQMPGLSWDFMRRFKRDLATGEVIELY